MSGILPKTFPIILWAGVREQKKKAETVESKWLLQGFRPPTCYPLKANNEHTCSV